MQHHALFDDLTFKQLGSYLAWQARIGTPNGRWDCLSSAGYLPFFKRSRIELLNIVQMVDSHQSRWFFPLQSIKSVSALETVECGLEFLFA